jgi:protein SMG6
MIPTHPFETARESVLSLWSQAAQARRSAPDACALELFVFLHGMLFANILRNEEWTMMATVNVGTLLEYGRPQGVLRRSGALG